MLVCMCRFPFPAVVGVHTPHEFEKFTSHHPLEKDELALVCIVSCVRPTHRTSCMDDVVGVENAHELPFRDLGGTRRIQGGTRRDALHDDHDDCAGP
jgi:hypothetical protein